MSVDTFKLSPHELDRIEREARSSGAYKQYRKLLKKGQSPRMALLLAARKFPGVHGTDSTFMKAENERVKLQYIEKDMEAILKIAKKAGISTAGKTYQGSLGRYTDPEAWVSGTGDVRLAAAKKGLSIQGMVKVENAPREMKAKPLSDKLVNEAVREYCEQNPALKQKVKHSAKVKAELKEKIIAKHGAKRPLLNQR